MAKKKDAELTLIQCSVGTKKRVKKYAKEKGMLLNKMVDKIINEAVKRNEIY